MNNNNTTSFSGVKGLYDRTVQENLKELHYKNACKQADEHFQDVYNLYNKRDTDDLMKLYSEISKYPHAFGIINKVILHILDERGYKQCTYCQEFYDKSELTPVKEIDCICEHCRRGIESRS